MTTRLYRNVPDAQEDLIAALTRYADLGIRFDTGFVGSVPVQASGRIGRRFFYFRFRGDTASLTIGSRDRRQDASHAKRDRTKALRQLRRGVKDDGLFGDWFVKKQLRRDKSLDRHPSAVIRYAVINDVTGEQWAGSLEPEEAAELFIRLMNSLEPATRPGKRFFRKWPAMRRGTYTPSPGWSKNVIRKASAKRR